MPIPKGTLIHKTDASGIVNGTVTASIKGHVYITNELSVQAVDALEQFDNLVRGVASKKCNKAAVTVTNFNNAPAQVIAELKSQGYLNVVAYGNNVQGSW